MDGVYADKLDGKIPRTFGNVKWPIFGSKEKQVKMAMQELSQTLKSDRALDAQRIFELANKADSLYVSQDSIERPNC